MKSKLQILQFLARPAAFLGMCTAVIVVWVSWPFIVRELVPRDWPTRGQSGDMFGSLNTLFTGLAFIGLVYTIVLQKLNALDEEKERKRQQFEATFFQLLRSAESIVEGVEYHRESRIFRGRDAFTFYYNQLHGQIDIERHKSKHNALTVVHSVYSNFYRNHQTTLGHYYRAFYHVFKYISLSCPENKTFYAHLVRAQLSNQQVLLLFYNGFDSVGHGFKRYIEEFALLKHLPRDQIYDPSLLENYNPRAYGI